MIFKKYFTIISLLLFSVFSFFGCANIEFIRAIDSSNTIIDKLVINLDESKINKSGNELADVMNSIDSDMISFRNEIEKWNKFAKKHNLFTTIGSDYHTSDNIHPEIGLINKEIDYNLIKTDKIIENILK